MLNLNRVNSCLAKALSEENRLLENPLKERVVLDDYKCDLFYDCDRPLIVEAKSVLSEDTTVIFPTIEGERAVTQLPKLARALQRGYDVRYCLVLLTPTVEHISFSKSSNFIKDFVHCMALGMNLNVYRTHITQQHEFYMEQDEEMAQKLRVSLQEWW